MMEFGVGDGRLEIEIENEINVNDSPNTQDWKKFRVVAGEFTEEERAFCIRNGLVAVDEDGDYRELSTIIDSDGDTDEEEENVEPTEPNEEKAERRKSRKSLSSFNKSVDDSLGSLNPRPSNSRKEKDNRKSNGRGSYTRVLSPLVTNSSMGEGLDEGSISGISKPDLLSPLYTPESKGGSSIKQMEDLDSTPTNVKSPEAELVNYSEATPKAATQGEGDVSLYERNETVPMATPERGMETLPFAFATPTPGKEGINSISAPATDPSAPGATPDRGMETLPFAFTSPSPGRASPGMNSISAPTPGSSDPMATPGREGIDSISAPTPDSSAVTPVTPFGSEDAHLTEPAPEVVGPIPTPKAFLNQEDESLASIECPATYSSPPDFNSPLPMHSNVSRLGSTLFQTPVSFLSPASRQRLNQTVELMDISYGDVADEIDANSSDSCKDDFSLKMDHPVVISEKYIEVPTNVQIIDEILDMKGTEENFFAGRMQSSTESSTPSTVIELAPKNREDQNNRAVAAATEKSRHYDILILEPREPNGTFGAGVDDEFVEEYLTSCVDTKGIDAMSPASVAEEISFNNTCDSLADISLDDISNTSFNLSDVEDDNGPPGPNESFRTCPSIVSTTSFTSCHEEIDDSHVEEGRSSIEPINEEVKSFEDLDDTMTMVEKLLMKAEELEAAESNNRPAEEMESKSPLSYLLHPPMTPAKMDFHSNTSPDELSPSIFATPKTPIKNKSANGVIFATPAGPAPRAKTTNLESNYFSPSSKPALPPTPPRITTKPSSPSPKSTPGSSPSPKRTTPRKLNNILDSPIRKTPVPPKVTGMKTPSKIMPVSSPVAQYIYSVPPPVQVRKMMNPPKMPSVPSPKNKNVDTRIPRMNKPSMPGPSVSDGETEFPVQKKPGRDTISSLFPQAKAGKELAQTNYVGPESVKSVSGSITTPSKLPTPKLGNTPAFGSSKHLGVRDSSNASMVAQQPAVRKFCPERLGKP